MKYVFWFVVLVVTAIFLDALVLMFLAAIIHGWWSSIPTMPVGIALALSAIYEMRALIRTSFDLVLEPKRHSHE